MAKKDEPFGNWFPADLNPVSTGDPAADAAIVALQQYPKAPASPSPIPGGSDYDEYVATAARVAGPTTP